MIPGSYLNVPPPPSSGGGGLDDASSVSEVSAISTSSSKLFGAGGPGGIGASEDSHVVLETSELGGLLTRHYLGREPFPDSSRSLLLLFVGTVAQHSISHSS